MSRAHPAATSSPNFQLIFNNALKAYEKRTKNDLVAHPLAAQLQVCKSPSAILSVLQQQVQELNQSKTTYERWTKWLDPTVDVLYSLSATLGESVGLVFSPAKVIFAALCVLLSAAKDVLASHDTLVNIFGHIEAFIQRLESYTDVPPTTEMFNIIMRVMVEVLCILAIATQEIKQSRMQRYIKKLLRRTDLEDALKRLDKLTDEARMAIAQNQKATCTSTVDGRARRVAAGVGNVNDRVASVGQRVKPLDDKVAAVADGTKRRRAVTLQKVNDVDYIKRNQLRESIHQWLSPSDPSTNHNIARGTRHKRTAYWFFQGSIFREWMSTGTLLWIHGKRGPFTGTSATQYPLTSVVLLAGSGKSVLCSTIIQDIEVMYNAGQASIVYFYFDFRNAKKQHLNDVIPSLITQLSDHSDACCDLLSHLYLTHDSGKKQPVDTVLAQCMKEMLALPDQPPIYLIIDALDECPSSPGTPSPRGRVLQLVKQLVELHLPNLHICVTSRPDVDIRQVIEPLTSLRISLHNQSGQKGDIEEYVRSVVYSDAEPSMKRWREEDRALVIKTLSERADGMYRWVVCQLETLRHCPPSSVPHTLDELPVSLEETYERILMEIKKSNREYALRLLQCLAVAIRPLRVTEISEILAVDFRDEGIPRLNPNWRWEDHERAILSSCSSFITVIDRDDHKDEEKKWYDDEWYEYKDSRKDNNLDGDPRVVQFTHASVKEFLTSPRLSCDPSHCRLVLEPAHTTLAKACLCVLLRLDNHLDKKAIQDSSPLAKYAAQYGMHHVRLGGASSHLQKALECLFDPDKPHFDMWLGLFDIDTRPTDGSTFYLFNAFQKSKATPLYYASLLGFHDLVKHLITKYPQDVNANGGYYVRPLVAALAGHHFETAEILHRNGGNVNLHGMGHRTPLHSAVYYGTVDVVRKLLDCGADNDSRDGTGGTALCYASHGIYLKDPNVVLVLLERGADVNARATDGSTPLHRASRSGNLELTRVLLEHGADLEAKDNSGRTPMQVATERHHSDITKLLLDHSQRQMRS